MSAVTLELPDYLHRSLEQLARHHGLSVQQLLVSAAAEKASALDAGSLLRDEAARGRREDFDAYLRAVPDVPPVPGDEK
jgi:predicted DNA-binding ribbon-helix-helix protein